MRIDGREATETWRNPNLAAGVAVGSENRRRYVDSGDRRGGAMRTRSVCAFETSKLLAWSRDRGRPPLRATLPEAPSTAKRQT
jgi:hypothetical protein